MIELQEKLNKNLKKNNENNGSPQQNSQEQIYSQNTTDNIILNDSTEIYSKDFKKASKLTHLKLLLWKNILIYRNNYKSLLFMIIAPIILNFIAQAFQNITDQKVLGVPILETEEFKIPQIPKCSTIRGNLNDCITVGIGIVGPKEDWMEQAIEAIKINNNLNDEDVQILNDILYPSIPYVTHYGFMDFLEKNPGKVKVGIEFCSSKMLMLDESKLSPFQFLDLGQQQIPSLYSANCKNLVLSRPDLQVPGDSENVYFPNSQYYNIMQNVTALNFKSVDLSNKPVELDQISMKLKLDVDESLIQYQQQKLGQQQPQIDISFRSYPQPIRRETNGYNLINAFGAFIFFLTPMFMFLSLLGEIVREKEYRLRQGMNIFGVSHSVFWLSWFITGLVFASFLAIYTVMLGHLFQFPIFLNCPVWIFFSLFFSFNFSLIFIAFFISTVVDNQKIANTVSYAFVLMCIVVELFFSSQSFISFFYVTEGPSWLPIFRAFLELYPPFSYSKIYSDIGYKSGFHFDIAEVKWVEGEGYTYEDYQQRLGGNLVRGKVFDRPSALDTTLALYVNSLLFLLLTLYFDNIIQSNRGHNNPWYFLFTKKFWCKKKYLREKQHQNAQAQKEYLYQIKMNQNQQKNNLLEKSVLSEKIKIQQQQCDDNNNIKGVRIGNLSKIYKQGIIKIQKKQALKELYLAIEKGELCTILGHNGSGKTTLINILTGMLDLDQGEVIINGLNLGTDLEQIRTQIGLCPQFDILWEDLTAFQHISLYCQIKGIKDKEIINQIADSKLKQVSLSHVKNAVTQTYSGGMKRRLSIALASIGNPSIMFLDEPTTGMDPKSRREVWSLIQELKKDKSIILTTHSMEEADILSDRIVVLVDGTLRCIGKSIDLKNQFGGVYRVELVVNLNNSNIVTQSLSKLFPDFKLVDTAGGSLVFTAPIDNSKSMIKFFQLIEDKQQASQELINKIENLDLTKINEIDSQQIIQCFVKDWGVSHATLEEVFMKITHKKESKIQINQNK